MVHDLAEEEHVIPGLAPVADTADQVRQGAADQRRADCRHRGRSRLPPTGNLGPPRQRGCGRFPITPECLPPRARRHAERLAEVVNADTLLILTDVEKAKLNFGKPNEQEVGKITLAQAKQYLAEGHFLAGSMGPKVRACVRFLEWGGKRAVITSLDKAVEALNDKTGTQITLG